MNNLIYSNTPNHTDRYAPVTDEKYVKTTNSSHE